MTCQNMAVNHYGTVTVHSPSDGNKKIRWWMKCHGEPQQVHLREDKLKLISQAANSCKQMFQKLRDGPASTKGLGKGRPISALANSQSQLLRFPVTGCQ